MRGETRPPPPPPLFSLYAPVGNGEERRCGGEREDLTCLFGPTFPVTWHMHVFRYSFSETMSRISIIVVCINVSSYLKFDESLFCPSFSSYSLFSLLSPPPLFSSSFLAAETKRRRFNFRVALPPLERRKEAEPKSQGPRSG